MKQPKSSLPSQSEPVAAHPVPTSGGSYILDETASTLSRAPDEVRDLTGVESPVEPLQSPVTEAE